MERVDDTIELLTRRAEGLYTLDELRAKIASGRKLRIKFGMDPTAPDIHIGHAVVLKLMRQFQDLGHVGVLIVGDYTAKIGDPSERDATRPLLDDDTIAQNAQTYLDQAGKILDTSSERLEVVRNSQWLSKLSFADVLKLSGQVTVQQMLQRENFKLRMDQQNQIAVSELMYPLMQGYDSVVVQADVELGGTDQTFNNLMGRQLQARDGQEKQVVIVMPLIPGTDGHEKMSKSKGNTIDLTDRPDEMFGKLMSIPDRLMRDYLQVLTPLPDERIESLVDPARTHPRQAKDILAHMLVEQIYDRDAAVAASAEFRRRFSEHQLPTDIETKHLAQSPVGIIAMIRSVGFASSNSEARRLVQQGGVTVNQDKITDPDAQVTVEGDCILKVGKRRVCRVAVR